MPDSPTFLSSLGPFLLGLLPGLAAALGAWNSFRAQPASTRLITFQADLTQANNKKTEAEANSIAYNTLSKALTDMGVVIDRLRKERDDALEREMAATKKLAQYEALARNIQRAEEEGPILERK